MRFNTANQFELDRLQEFVKRNTGKKLDVTAVRYKRSLSQNAYLHLLLQYFGTQAGYTLEEAKDIYKKLNHAIYQYEKQGRVFYRSSADLNSADMVKTIDRFREWSAEQGIQLPLANDQEFLKYCDDVIAQHASFL